jgi:hypothetical protein
MKWLLMFALACGIAGLTVAARAEDKKATGPTGTWKWTVENNGQTRDLSMKLELDKDGKTLTGSLPGRQGAETKIADGKFDKDKGLITFTVTRERNGNKMVSTYTGTLKDDSIKFKQEFEVNGEKMTREFEAKRATEEKKEEKKDK